MSSLYVVVLVAVFFFFRKKSSFFFFFSSQNLSFVLLRCVSTSVISLFLLVSSVQPAFNIISVSVDLFKFYEYHLFNFSDHFRVIIYLHRLKCWPFSCHLSVCFNENKIKNLDFHMAVVTLFYFVLI